MPAASSSSGGGEAGPLSSMTRLSSAVYLSQPPGSNHSQRPRLIFLLGWVAARDGHLFKYVSSYRYLDPTATLVLIKARVLTMGSPSAAARDVSPAVSILHSHFNSSATTSTVKPDLHIHLFSNGGSCLLANIIVLYAPDVLPRHTTIYDSAPSLRFDTGQIVHAITAGLPAGLYRTSARPMVYLFVLLYWLRIYLLRNPDQFAAWTSMQNNPDVVLEAIRVYMYSDTDPIISSQEVEAHARDAEGKGFVVRREVFKGSGHVAHALSESNRYWRVVRDVLQEGGKFRAKLA
ncbi:hypothetical protein B0A48_08212 [Cryoendolithus antarcticus]|uniref:Indole-diterpene biosynthesis protein PaxU n=1 Tax=Cryoendolithus antarcticus TaxID=1507870 RepID=A0A1V8T541_9PEZI|nr:hypothetical protein B0A48_08212 [Cryoendolithus antarcticus]